MLKKISLLGLIFTIILLFSFSFFIVENVYDNTESLIGLTIDGVSTKNFPSKTSGYAIESILCDKDATGVWDYENWTLKIRNMTQSRTKCQINFVSRYTEDILNGTDPVLKDELIPVTIENDGTVKKASLGWEWYKYKDKKWANAIILNDETEVYYDGDVIPEESIESYFVWIPRYRYQIFNEGKYTGQISSVTNASKEIKIEFENKNIEPSNGSTVGSWLTHPAFTAFDINGIWVGKFEVGYKGASTPDEAKKNENNSNKIQVKPNVYSWRGIQVANAHLSSYHYKRNLDSHMMKNTEWGAVAYLQHSAYGSKASVRINNNENYISGYAGVHEPTCGYTGANETCNRYEKTNLGVDGTYTVNYFNSSSQVASTTGNYSGIYDMSGGANEYVMGVIKTTNDVLCSGRNPSDHSGFNGSYCGDSGSFKDGEEFPNHRYLDTYKAGESGNTNYNRRILGDATGEMGPFTTRNGEKRTAGSWYFDEAMFVFSALPWVIRGGGNDSGIGAGIFYFHHASGGIYSNYSFRIALSIP